MILRFYLLLLSLFIRNIDTCRVLIDTTGNTGYEPSVALLVNGHPAVAYNEKSADDLMFATAKDAFGAEWNTPLNLHSDGLAGREPAMTRRTDGRLCIAYDHLIAVRTFHVICAADELATEWNLPTQVGAFYARFPTMKVLEDGRLAIAFHEEIADQLQFIASSDTLGSEWPVTPVVLDPNGNNGLRPSMTLQADNRPVITYYAVSGLELRCVVATTPAAISWSAPVLVDMNGNVGSSSSIILLSNQRLGIAYRDNSQSALRWRVSGDNVGADWSPPSILLDAEGNAGDYQSALLLSDGGVAIAYQSAGDDMSVVLTNDSTAMSWPHAPVDVDTDGSVGNDVSAVLLSDGRIGMAYSDRTHNELWWAAAGNGCCGGWVADCVPESITSIAGTATTVSTAMSVESTNSLASTQTSGKSGLVTSTETRAATTGSATTPTVTAVLTTGESIDVLTEPTRTNSSSDIMMIAVLSGIVLLLLCLVSAVIIVFLRRTRRRRQHMGVQDGGGSVSPRLRGSRSSAARGSRHHGGSRQTSRGHLHRVEGGTARTSTRASTRASFSSALPKHPNMIDVNHTYAPVPRSNTTATTYSSLEMAKKYGLSLRSPVAASPIAPAPPNQAARQYVAVPGIVANDGNYSDLPSESHERGSDGAYSDLPMGGHQYTPGPNPAQYVEGTLAR